MSASEWWDCVRRSIRAERYARYWPIAGICCSAANGPLAGVLLPQVATSDLSQVCDVAGRAATRQGTVCLNWPLVTRMLVLGHCGKPATVLMPRGPAASCLESDL